MSADNTGPTEAELLERITTALHDECDRRGITLTPGDAIKTQKYVDLVLEEFLGDVENPPVTMSWFKFGRTTPAGGGGVALAEPETTVSPTNQGDRTAEFLSMDSTDFQDFYRFGSYEPSLEHANEPLLPFLRRYYHIHAPDRFHELYLVNVRLREALQELRRATDPETNKQLSRAAGEQLYRDVAQLTSRLEILLCDDYVYYPVATVIPQYLRLLEQSFAGMATQETELATHERYTFALEIEDFYNEVAWTKIAHCISRETAVGPGADTLKEQSKNALRDFEPEFTAEVENLKETCIRVGAFPAPSDYPARTDETSSTLEELLRVASQPVDEDLGVDDPAITDNTQEDTDE
ncbi:hypothetical protein [Halarchaeum sp. P4]|uniref:hypothetical protein n=1 Tax=Halarchaeum sp. P4 TaxID=3421639 RepID=UPI003EBC426E